MNRKTAIILASAAGLVAAAIVLGKQEGDGARAATSPTARPTPVVLECGAGGPATATASFGHGTMTAALSGGKILKGADGEVYMSVDIEAAKAAVKDRPPLSLAIVVDRSGSMSGEKLEQAKKAAEGIVSRLGETDQVALIQYDDSAQVVVGLVAMDAEGKARMQAAIEGLTTGGSTNLHHGMVLGRDEVQKGLRAGAINRVILLSDGLANVGVTDTPTLAQTAGDAADKGIRITTVGVGLDYNEDLMEALAENGRGHYYYVKDAASLESVFAGELQAIQATVATKAELRLAPACPGVEILEVYGYEWKKEGEQVVIPMADLFGGDKRKVVVRVKTPAKALGRTSVLGVTLAYDDADKGVRTETAVALGIEVSDDAAAVEKAVNKDVLTQALEVESARAMREAADAYKRGDVQRAQTINRDWRKKAEKEAGRYALPTEEVDGLYDDLDNQWSGMGSYAPASAEGKAMIKGSKARARDLSKKK